jgi:hypothetical protein
MANYTRCPQCRTNYRIERARLATILLSRPFQYGATGVLSVVVVYVLGAFFLNFLMPLLYYAVHGIWRVDGKQQKAIQYIISNTYAKMGYPNPPWRQISYDVVTRKLGKAWYWRVFGHHIDCLACGLALWGLSGMFNYLGYELWNIYLHWNNVRVRYVTYVCVCAVDMYMYRLLLLA